MAKLDAGRQLGIKIFMLSRPNIGPLPKKCAYYHDIDNVLVGILDVLVRNGIQFD